MAVAGLTGEIRAAVAGIVPSCPSSTCRQARVALVALRFGSFQTADRSDDESARRAAAVEVALDLAVR